MHRHEDARPLTGEDDLAARMVAGIDRYLMRELAAGCAERGASLPLSGIPELVTPRRAEVH